MTAQEKGYRRDTIVTDDDVAQCWDAHAEAWTALSRAGYDLSRDGFNTPAFLATLPDICGLHGLDLGCGEGHHTRLVAFFLHIRCRATQHGPSA